MNKREEKLTNRALILGLLIGIATSFYFTRLVYLSSPSSESVRVQETTGLSAFMKVNAYCPCERCCGRWADGYTASGYKIQPRDKFAAAPKHIPFGTMMDVPGYGIVPVRDRGGAIVTSRLDVFFPTHKEASDWGVKYLEVEVK